MGSAGYCRRLLTATPTMGAKIVTVERDAKRFPCHSGFSEPTNSLLTRPELLLILRTNPRPDLISSDNTHKNPDWQ
jgi:hypothetical protein